MTPRTASGEPPVGTRTRILARSLFPALVAVTVIAVSAFDAAGLPAERDAAYVAAAVLLPLSIVVSLLLTRWGIVGSILVTAVLVLFFSLIAGIPLIVLLQAVGHDFGATALTVAAVAWSVPAFLVVLLLAVLGAGGDRYAGGWAP